MVRKKENHEEHSEQKSDDGKVGNFFANNYWMIAAIILAVVLVGVLIFNSVKGISASEAEQKTVSFLVSGYGLSESMIEVKGVSSAGDFYFVNFSVQGQTGQFAVSKDGKYIGQMVEVKAVSSGDNNDDTPASTEIPKSDKPTTELFVWSYCPYGVTAQKPFSEVAKLLGSSADFKVVLYYDGHGAYETQQNKIQACIQKYDKAKYWDYSIQFVDKVYPKCGTERTEACDKTESTAAMKTLGIDSAKIFTCVSSEGASLIASDAARAQSLGVTGSPTLVVNGVISSAARTADSYKTEICGAFNSAPSACGTALSTAAGSTTGNC
jgi:protein-disulfide isomerase